MFLIMVNTSSINIMNNIGDIFEPYGNPLWYRLFSFPNNEKFTEFKISFIKAIVLLCSPFSSNFYISIL